MLRWLVLAACVVTLGFAGAAEATTPPAPPDTVSATANEFLPEDQDLSNCVSAVPQPDCGSEARGGWRQAILIVLIVLALAFIAWRIVRNARGRLG